MVVGQPCETHVQLGWMGPDDVSGKGPPSLFLLALYFPLSKIDARFALAGWSMTNVCRSNTTLAVRLVGGEAPVYKRNRVERANNGVLVTNRSWQGRRLWHPHPAWRSLSSNLGFLPCRERAAGLGAKVMSLSHVTSRGARHAISYLKFVERPQRFCVSSQHAKLITGHEKFCQASGASHRPRHPGCVILPKSHTHPAARHLHADMGRRVLAAKNQGRSLNSQVGRPCGTGLCRKGGGRRK